MKVVKKRNNKKSFNVLKWTFLGILILVELVVFSAGYFVGYNVAENNNETVVQEEKVEKIVLDVHEGTVDEIVDQLMADMDISEMIYQMMFVTPEELTNVGTVVMAGDATKLALEERPVGGIVYFAQNLENREQTIQMISNTQKFSKIPLFMAVDEEGGRVARLGKNPEMGTTNHPPMRTIGDTGDPQKAYEVGSILGAELKELGFNIDFAPVADVILDDSNEEIGDRSFGTDAGVVSLMVENTVKGLRENGVAATLKHFPGHGSTYIDSHTGYSDSSRTLDELRNTEFLPFKAGIEAGAEFVMISHMTLVNATEEKLPSSMSKEVVTDMLIDELGFEGIILTDSFSMGAITTEHNISEAAVKSINAGVDMMLMAANLDETYNGIYNAVMSGEISEERIKESVRKILKMKIQMNLFDSEQVRISE